MIKEAILQVLEHKPLPAEEIRAALDLDHDRMYLALAQLEAQGAVDIEVAYQRNDRRGCLWRNCLVLE